MAALIEVAMSSSESNNKGSRWMLSDFRKFVNPTTVLSTQLLTNWIDFEIRINFLNGS